MRNLLRASKLCVIAIVASACSSADFGGSDLVANEAGALGEVEDGHADSVDTAPTPDVTPEALATADSAPEATPDAGPEATPDAGPEVVANCAIVDDMLHADPDLPTRCGRSGRWATFNNGSAGTQSPPPSSPLVPVPTGDASPLKALHVTSTGFTSVGTWIGSWWGFSWTNPESAYDLGGAVGIRFSARLDPGVTSGDVNIFFPDAETNPSGDHFNVKVVLSSSWKSYTILFRDLRQAGWGKPEPAFDAHQSLGIIFPVAAGTTYGVWIAGVDLVMP